MNKLRRFCLIAIFLIQTSVLMATPIAEVRVGAFFPTSQTFKKIYGHCLPCYQLNALIPFECSPLQSWVGFDYVHGSGHVSTCKGHSHINLYTLNCGIQYDFCLSHCFDAYIGIGPSFAFVHIENKFCHINDKSSKGSVGGIVKSGLVYRFCEQFLAEFFADYTYQKIHFKKNADIGGFRTGLGLGYQF